MSAVQSFATVFLHGFPAIAAAMVAMTVWAFRKPDA